MAEIGIRLRRGDHREDSEIPAGVGIFPDVRENPRKKLEE